MRTKGSAAELERRRSLAVQRYVEGGTTEEIAHFLGVDPRSVRRWVAAFLSQGDTGLRARPVPGRPCKLTPAQEETVLTWFRQKPTDHGFPNELWTAPRAAQRIQREWGIILNPRYLNAWLRERGITPQKPRPVSRDRDPEAIAHWVAHDWPRIQKKCAGSRPTWFLGMNVAC